MKRRLGKIITWFKKYILPAKVVFIISGILSTIWFLVRVIPKPSRATYPCMRMAAPIMSGFVVYLLSLGGIALMLRKARRLFLRARYWTAGILVMAAVIVMAVFMVRNSPDSLASGLEKTGPDLLYFAL